MSLHRAAGLVNRVLIRPLSTAQRLCIAPDEHLFWRPYRHVLSPSHTRVDRLNAGQPFKEPGQRYACFCPGERSPKAEMSAQPNERCRFSRARGLKNQDGGEMLRISIGGRDMQDNGIAFSDRLIA